MSIADIDGTRLHYDEQGAGPPVLFLHGTGAHAPVAWEKCLRELPPGYRLITYDRRGFGRSAGALARRLSDHVDDAVALLGQLDAAPATIVSQSGGSVIALQLATRHPELVSGLVMAEPAYQVALHSSLSVSTAMVKTLTRWLIRRDPRGAALGYYRWATTYTTGGNAFDTYPEDWRRAGMDHAQASLREILQLIPPSPARRKVRSVSCPVTLLIGDLGEPVFRRTTRRVNRLLPRAQLVTVSKTCHLISTDQPQATAQAIAQALRAAG